MRSIHEKTLTIKLSVSEAITLRKSLPPSDSIRDRLDEALTSFFHSKPNILDYSPQEWPLIEEVFKFCIRMSNDGELIKEKK